MARPTNRRDDTQIVNGTEKKQDVINISWSKHKKKNEVNRSFKIKTWKLIPAKKFLKCYE
jgi:hypothetical protein